MVAQLPDRLAHRVRARRGDEASREQLGRAARGLAHDPRRYAFVAGQTQQPAQPARQVRELVAEVLGGQPLRLGATAAVVDRGEHVEVAQQPAAEPLVGGGQAQQPVLDALGRPGPIEVNHLDHCEYASAALRMRWNLGDRPVDSLVEQIEEHGCAVVTWPEEWGFDGLSGRANQTPVLVLNEAAPADRLRFNAAHELGHLVMASTGDAKRDEAFAHRFAASFLVPAEAARRELGPRRRGLTVDELGLLKQRWGLSMQAWIRRAHELEIIGDQLYRRLNMRFRREGWHVEEPFAYERTESPTLQRRLVLRALTERMITPEEADRLYPGSASDAPQAQSGRSSLRDLARLPLEERHQAIRAAGISVDADEIEAWDETAGDGLEE